MLVGQFGHRFDGHAKTRAELNSAHGDHSNATGLQRFCQLCDSLIGSKGVGVQPRDPKLVRFGGHQPGGGVGRKFATEENHAVAGLPRDRGSDRRNGQAGVGDQCDAMVIETQQLPGQFSGLNQIREEAMHRRHPRLGMTGQVVIHGSLNGLGKWTDRGMIGKYALIECGEECSGADAWEYFHGFRPSGPHD